MNETITINLNVSPLSILALKPIEKPRIRVNGLSRKIVFIINKYGALTGLTLGEISSIINSKEEVKEKTIKQSLYRLRKRGLVLNFNHRWSLTEDGAYYVWGLINEVGEWFLNKCSKEDREYFVKEHVQTLFIEIVKDAVITDCLFNHSIKLGKKSIADLVFALDFLERIGLIVKEELKEEIRIKPSIFLKMLILRKRRINKRGFVEIKQLEDITVRRKWVYERVFRIKKKPLPIEDLRNYVEDLRKRFPKRYISLVEEHNRLVLINVKVDCLIEFYPRLNGFRIFTRKQDWDKNKALVLHILRSVLTKLKLLEKPVYRRVENG